MKKEIVLGLIVFCLLAIAVLAVTTGCTEKPSVTVTYRVKIGNPAGGLFGGYIKECYYTNDTPQLDEPNKTVIVTNYYWGSCRASEWKHGPFGALTKVVSEDGYIEVSDKGFTISIEKK